MKLIKKIIGVFVIWTLFSLLIRGMAMVEEKIIIGLGAGYAYAMVLVGLTFLFYKLLEWFFD